MTKTLEQRVKFAASPADLYRLYLDPKRHGEAIGSTTTVAAKVGAAFAAWDGYCTGRILHLVPDRMIVQTWRGSDWDAADPDSILILRFSAAGKGAELHLLHANVPSEHAASLDQGWKEHYWTPWKEYLRG